MANGRLELTWMNKDKVLISSKDGRYDYTWVEPTDFRAREIRLVDEVGGMVGEDKRPADRRGGENHLPDPTSENILFTGDALHVLEALVRVPELAEQYLGKVKLVYIDPPFNTGQAFEHYEDNLEHSIWLTMLRDRLRQLKPLLAEDASVWVHLDDVEVHRMRIVLDEEFGQGNFVAQVAWQKADSPRSDASGRFSSSYDTILVYRKSPLFSMNRLERTLADDLRFTNPDDDPRGPWWDDNPTANHGDGAGGMCYAIQSPLTGKMLVPAKGANWRYGQERILAALREWAPYRLENLHDEERRAANDSIPFSKVKRDVCALVLDAPLEECQRMVAERREKGNWPEYIVRRSGGLGRKAYIPSTGKVPVTWWPHEEVGHNRSAKAELKALFRGSVPFSTPKPERLIERVVQIGSNPGDIVLDFFGGSGTTAAVAHKLGRRWVLAELSGENVANYIQPRLEKVIRGEDLGGITRSTASAAVSDLPAGVLPEQAKQFTSLLTKFAKALDAAASDSGVSDTDEADDSDALAGEEADGPDASVGDEDVFADESLAQTVKRLKRLARTKKVTSKNWFGGGGYRQLAIRESMFDQIEEFVVIAEWARGGELARVVATQFSFRFDDSRYPFSGLSGRRRLAVIDGSVDAPLVRHIGSFLGVGESVAIYGTAIDPLARAELSSGSTLEAVPAAILESYRKTVRRNRPLDWANAVKEDDGR